jgi:predicted Rossmann fold nucleotide-binding protein DprA/Smf involved in DNA uptake
MNWDFAPRAIGDSRWLDAPAIGVIGTTAPTPEAIAILPLWVREMEAIGIRVAAYRRKGIGELVILAASNPIVLSQDESVELPFHCPVAIYHPCPKVLLSSLSGLLIPEASWPSEAVDLAMDMIGRIPVMAVPGPLGNPRKKGCHRLIKEGAILVESTEDIIEVLAIERSMKSRLNPQPPFAF